MTSSAIASSIYSRDISGHSRYFSKRELMGGTSPIIYERAGEPSSMPFGSLESYSGVPSLKFFPS